MRLRLMLCGAVLALVAPVAASQRPATADAERMGKKVQAIQERAVAPATAAKPLKTSFSERELNAYLRLNASAELPSGVTQAQVTLLDAGKVDTRALVDLDVLRTAEKRGWLDPLAYVSGILEVRTIGTFRGANGKGVFTFESATVDGVPVPRVLMQELVAFYTRTPETPKGILLDQPFDLPAGIREVQLRRGVATVIQ